MPPGYNDPPPGPLRSVIEHLERSGSEDENGLDMAAMQESDQGININQSDNVSDVDNDEIVADVELAFAELSLEMETLSGMVS